jgi:hypothetical protein
MAVFTVANLYLKPSAKTIAAIVLRMRLRNRITPHIKKEKSK